MPIFIQPIIFPIFNDIFTSLFRLRIIPRHAWGYSVSLLLFFTVIRETLILCLHLVWDAFLSHIEYLEWDALWH